MNYIILDLEATCWKDRNTNKQNEIIEIGALKVNQNKEIESEFAAFVKPKLNPHLSEFCTELTTIEQSDVDGAMPFDAVIKDFQNWINLEEAYCLCSWGFYDKKQFKMDCELFGLDTSWLKRHISLKHQHADIMKLHRPMGMDGALKMEKIPMEGTHHRGIDDARNITKIFLAHFSEWRIK